jgi:hypothetical protein
MAADGLKLKKGRRQAVGVGIETGGDQGVAPPMSLTALEDSEAALFSFLTVPSAFLSFQAFP